MRQSKQPSPSQAKSDAELVRATLAGHREAYELIVKKYNRAITNCCWRRLARHDLVPDLVQETFLRGYQNLARLRKPESLGSWLQGIARLVCNESLKEIKRFPTPLSSSAHGESGIEEMVASDTLPDEKLQREEMYQCLIEAIDSLPEKYREALLLLYSPDLSREQIAKQLGLTRAGLNTRIARAHKLLRRNTESKLFGSTTP